MSKITTDIVGDNEQDYPNDAVLSEVPISRINDQDLCVSPNKFVSTDPQIANHIHLKNITFSSTAVLGERLIGISKSKRNSLWTTYVGFLARAIIY